MKYKAGVALKRKIVFPLFSTINVCGEKKEREREPINEHLDKNTLIISAIALNVNYTYSMQLIKQVQI